MEKTIIEGNKLIHEFMGWKWFDKRYPRNHGIGAPEAWDMPQNQNDIIIQKAKYHSSWEWLMPVVEKIMSLGFRVEALFSSVDNSVHITDGEERLNIVSYSDPKQCIYTAVIQFIHWYNSQGVKPAK